MTHLDLALVGGARSSRSRCLDRATARRLDPDASRPTRRLTPHASRKRRCPTAPQGGAAQKSRPRRSARSRSGPAAIRGPATTRAALLAEHAARVAVLRDPAAAKARRRRRQGRRRRRAAAAWPRRRRRARPVRTSRVLHRLQGGRPPRRRRRERAAGEPAVPGTRPAERLVADGDRRTRRRLAEGLPGFHAAASRFFGCRPAAAVRLHAAHGGLARRPLRARAPLRPPRPRQVARAPRRRQAAAAERRRHARARRDRQGLRKLSAELKELGEAAPARRGDYVMWDRAAALDGRARRAQRRRRHRRLYCAFMLARDNGALAAEQRACRDSGLHPSWAPNTHRHDEARSDYVAAPLGELGDALYGYGCAARSADQDRHALAEARAKQRAADDGRGRRPRAAATARAG